jgi:hypothetical protein
MPSKNKRADPDQGARFIETARQSGADESGEKFEKAFKKIVPRKTKTRRNVKTIP